MRRRTIGRHGSEPHPFRYSPRPLILPRQGKVAPKATEGEGSNALGAIVRFITVATARAGHHQQTDRRPPPPSALLTRSLSPPPGRGRTVLPSSSPARGRWRRRRRRGRVATHSEPSSASPQSLLPALDTTSKPIATRPSVSPAYAEPATSPWRGRTVVPSSSPARGRWRRRRRRVATCSEPSSTSLQSRLPARTPPANRSPPAPPSAPAYAGPATSPWRGRVRNGLF
jgi:hypothetical protein